MQYFKGDDLEIKMVNSALPVLTQVGQSLTQFFELCYKTVPMGELLFDEKRVPLTRAVKRDVFIHAFNEIFTAWSFCGTFESYIVVFRKIFGEDATIEFTVPGPGELQINIEASLQESPFICREIVDNAYVYNNVVDDVGDYIVFTSVAGIETESELEKLVFSMTPNGIYTEISLTIL